MPPSCLAFAAVQIVMFDRHPQRPEAQGGGGSASLTAAEMLQHRTFVAEVVHLISLLHAVSCQVGGFYSCGVRWAGGGGGEKCWVAETSCPLAVVAVVVHLLSWLQGVSCQVGGALVRA
jgi:hypothetical protein